MDDPEREPCLWITEHLTPYGTVSHGVKQLYASKQTKYQSMIIADIGPYGKALVLDGRIQTTTGDEYLYHEPIIHLPSLLHGRPKKVLILGGADLGAAREALKWKTVEEVVVIDIDGDVVELCAKHLPEIAQDSADDERCKLIIGDALKYIDETDEKYDVIIGDLTDPIENSPSIELFTRSFYEKIKQCLNESGVYVTQAGTISLQEEKVFPRVANTLKTLFKEVVPFSSFIPTYGTPLGFLVSSDSKLVINLTPDEIDEKLDSNLHKGRETLRFLDGTSFLGLFGLPANVRSSIQSESIVYK
eukprot:CAMPEP_0184740456 /NCGR_PEP_ID=MMETSP0315-20130426/3476_1 /TAXON_ID=101924 /ORGANISM="Rhodosorus marinus, Strain UTEX LB 2760" /LENGTH=302 /DNA_ID=CAMNT_0027210143 /DNA_START=129 /DNA_END=1037 /DNA_ORIENTATION=+